MLPTGAGKTDVAVGWLLQQLQHDPQLRVLWLAHQISLLDQSAVRFERAAHQLPAGFERTLRIFAGDREPTSLLDRRHTHVACATIQTISRKLDRRSRRRTEVSSFLKGPTVVIVDEAHHVASRSYQLLLDLVGDAEIHDVVGLTATPWGQGERQDRIDTAFPQRVISRTREELIAEGVLAAYAVTPVRTHLRIPVTADEREQAERVGDLPMTVLRKLESAERNAVVLRVYQARADAWGRTLLFTTTIENADELATQFQAAGIDARALHSQSEATLSNLRPWFKAHPHAVLISVGMLLEGVDLPEARTALIARATTSPNVLSQMVGRVLRGVAAGGEATANVVYLQDDWDDFAGVLSPAGAWEGGDSAPLRTGPPDVAAAVAAALRRRRLRSRPNTSARPTCRSRSSSARSSAPTSSRTPPSPSSTTSTTCSASTSSTAARSAGPMTHPRRRSPTSISSASNGTSPSTARHLRFTPSRAASRRSTSPAPSPTTRRGPSPSARP